MNITHVLSQNELTGAEVYAVHLIQEQISEGHTVYQFSNGFFTETKAQKFQIEIETRSLVLFWKNVVKLRNFFIQNNIHVVHTHSRAAAKMVYYATRFLKKNSKIGVVSSVHGRQHVSFSKKIINQYGHIIVSICENIKSQLVNEFKYNSRFIKVIPNGIDPNDFQYVEKPEYDIPKKKLKIAIIGRMSGPKKVRTELILKYFPELLKKEHLEFEIELIGHQLPLIKIDSSLLSTFDLIIGSGRVCIEAIICGTPCIAFGEANYLGLITNQNMLEFAKSSFGDIGTSFKQPEFNSDFARRDIEIIKNNILSPTELKLLSNLALSYFSNKMIHKKIMRVYESAYFISHYKKWIPVLMYHKIPNQELQSKHKIYVTKENFEKHLKLFQLKKLTSMTFDELACFRQAKKPWSEFPKNPFILTFDDGYEDNLINADPLLKKYGFKANIYLLADQTKNHNSWDAEDQNSNESHAIVSNEKRLNWKNTAFKIGSHGIKHDRLTEMPLKEKIKELTVSKTMLEKEFNHSINSYAFTYGDTNEDCAKACQAAGYDYGLNTDTGGLSLEENPYSIFRANIFPNESWLSLWKKTSSWYRNYYFYKRNK